MDWKQRLANTPYLVVILLLSIGVGTTSFVIDAKAQESSVPEWIKQTAIWWGEGKISTQEYLDSISFLIEDEIIEVPGFVKTAEGQELTQTSQQEMWNAIGDLQSRMETQERFESELFASKVLQIISQNIYVKSKWFWDDPTNVHSNTLKCDPGDLLITGGMDGAAPTGSFFQAPQNLNTYSLNYTNENAQLDKKIPNQWHGYFDRVDASEEVKSYIVITCLNISDQPLGDNLVDSDTEIMMTKEEAMSRGALSGLEEVNKGTNLDSTDKDGDGIPDDKDNCPEIYNPKQIDSDRDGLCNEVDNDDDNDKILDQYDKCPTELETFNGYLDEDGCPDDDLVDSDGDGVNDRYDKCPTTPEDKNGYQDDDGCPDGRQ